MPLTKPHDILRELRDAQVHPKLIQAVCDLAEENLQRKRELMTAAELLNQLTSQLDTMMNVAQRTQSAVDKIRKIRGIDDEDLGFTEGEDIN